MKTKLIAWLGPLIICSCASNDPAGPDPNASLNLGSFDLVVGNRMVFRSTATSIGPSVERIDTLLVTNRTGTSGAEVLSWNGAETYRMNSGTLQIFEGSWRPLAKFPSVAGDTVGFGADTLMNGALIGQIYAWTVTTVNADTTVVEPAGTFRCALVRIESTPLLGTGTAPVTQIGLQFVSPKYGTVSSSNQLWAGASASGPAFQTTTAQLIEIIR